MATKTTMTTAELIEKYGSQISALNAALVSKKQSAQEWTTASENDADETETATLAHKMRADNLTYQNLKLDLEIDAEKFIGTGSELGDFWDAIYELR